MHRADLIGNCGNTRGAKVGDDNTHALISQQVSGGPAHPAGRTGDDGNAAVQGTRQLRQARHGRIS